VGSAIFSNLCSLNSGKGTSYPMTSIPIFRVRGVLLADMEIIQVVLTQDTTLGWKKTAAFMFSNPELGCHPIGDPTSYFCQIVLSGAIPKTSTCGLPQEVASMAELRAVAHYYR
jgi:hypothetical protein